MATSSQAGRNGIICGMARTVFLVRHGQASFGKADYDQLSPTGHQQARALGESLRRRGWAPDRIVCGTMKRHRQSVAEILVGAQLDDTQSHDTAELEIDYDPAWNEMDHVEVITGFRPAYRNMLVMKADMVRTLRPRAAFEDMFLQAITRWAGGEHDEDYAETFEGFTTRVSGALESLVGADGERTLVVSSIGVIAWLVTGLLGGQPEPTWRELSMAGFNTGVTRLQIDKTGPHLLTFNEISHLEVATLVTNR
ncbi:histidine phosphatase family protein [Dermatophilaceae bacterium Sec6.4]